MKWKIFALASLVLTAFYTPQQTAVLTGKVTDENGDGLVGATILVRQNGTRIKGAVCDVDGNYRLSLDPGKYDVEASYTGYSTQKVSKVQVKENELTTLNFSMKSPVMLEEVVVSQYKVPLIQQDNTSSGQVISPNPSRSMPTRSVKAVSATTAGASSINGSNPNIRGSRSNQTNYYIDGIRVTGSVKEQEAPKGKKRHAPKDSSILETPNTEQYNAITDNPFLSTRDSAFSTFSIDVDAASYANVRRFINANQLPPADAVRIEELINYFDYQYAQPTDGRPFAVHTEAGACPWAPSHSLVLVGIQGRDIDAGQLPPSNFVFLIDVSGSMGSPDKLPLVIQSLSLLTDKLRPEDHVAIAVYAGAAGLVLPPTPGSDKTTIKAALERLSAGGSTAGAQGIELAYNTAQANFIKGGNNRVVLCTDGDFNVGISDEASLITLIEEKRKSGIYLSVLGFGTGNYQDGKMQQLADKGNGNHAYIDQLSEAQKVLVSEFGGTLFTIAKDVKIQIEFNPDRVAGYRLIGYENRILNKQDFADDTKDAGELGAGHRVTALYEVIPAGSEVPVLNNKAELDWQKTKSAPQGADDRMLTLRLRYKEPGKGEVSKLIESTVRDRVDAQPSENFQLAASVACFGMLLRKSPYKGACTFDMALDLGKKGAATDPGGYRKEYLELVKNAKKL